MKIGFEKLGWLVAAGLGAMFVASGFEPAATKIGVVDVQRAITESDSYKKSMNDLQAAFKQRGDLLDYINTYPVFTVTQATRFRDLTLKAQPTAAETTELNKIKADVKDQDDKFRVLQQKQNPTAADKQALDDYGKRVQALGQLIADWRQQFSTDLQGMQDKAQQANQDAVRGAIETVGKNQAFTLIFIKDVAPFGVNDTTTDVLKAVNKK